MLLSVHISIAFLAFCTYSLLQIFCKHVYIFNICGTLKTHWNTDLVLLFNCSCCSCPNYISTSVTLVEFCLTSSANISFICCKIGFEYLVRRYLMEAFFKESTYFIKIFGVPPLNSIEMKLIECVFIAKYLEIYKQS